MYGLLFLRKLLRHDLWICHSISFDIECVSIKVFLGNRKLEITIIAICIYICGPRHSSRIPFILALDSGVLDFPPKQLVAKLGIYLKVSILVEFQFVELRSIALQSDTLNLKTHSCA
jgi:hypothetical protein